MSEAGSQMTPRLYRVILPVHDIEASVSFYNKLLGIDGERVESMPWGERLFYMRDPAGNPVCLVDADTLFLGQQI